MSTPTPAAPAAIVPVTTAPETSSEAPVEAQELNSEATPVVPESKETKATEATKRGKKKFGLKVDGEDSEIELDLDNEEEIRKHLQLSKAAYKRMQEKAEMQKGVQELLDALRTDPLKVLADPRLEIPEEVRKKLAESIINNEIDEMNKTPEQKEIEKVRKDYEKLKKEHEDAKTAKEAAERQQLEQKYANDLDVEMSEAIQSAGLPRNARTVRYLAEALSFCVKNDIQMTAKELAPYVRKQTLAEFKEIVSSLPDEEFEDWVGKERLDGRRKKRLAAAKTENPANIPTTTAQTKEKEDKKEKKVKASDFFNTLGKW